jgi:fatty-acyl-CoA synthase
VSSCKGVVEVAAIAVPDKKWGERPMLIILAADAVNVGVIEAAIKKLIQHHIHCGTLSKWAMPDQIKFVSEIAKTSVGKIDKKAMRAFFAK